MQRENRSKTVKRSQNFKRVVADKMFIFLYSNTIHKGNTWWEISVTTLMAQYMCWPLSSSCRKRYETKIDTKVSVSPLERMGQEKCHRHTCFQWWLHYVSKYVFFLYITYSNTYFLYMFIYMLKGSITDGHGFEPQRFTGLQTLAQRNCRWSSPPLTPPLSTRPPPSTEGGWQLLLKMLRMVMLMISRSGRRRANLQLVALLLFYTTRRSARLPFIGSNWPANQTKSTIDDRFQSFLTQALWFLGSRLLWLEVSVSV